MTVKIMFAAMVYASILIPAFTAYADQGAAAAGNGYYSAPSAGKKQSFKVLSPDESFSFRWLAKDTHYEANLFVASAIEFELGEDFDRKAYWNIDHYDAKICQLDMRHIQKGFLDWQGDRARIKLRALRRGSTDVILSREGKKFTVHLTVK